MKSKTPILLKGLPVSKGIAIGRSYLIEHGKNIIKEKYIKKEHVSRELKMLDKSIDLTIKEIEVIKEKINPSIKSNVDLFLDTHIMLVKDESFINNIKSRISEKLNSPEWAIHNEYLSIKQSFNDIDDTYIKQRIDDVNHVVKMIIKNLKLKK